MKYSELVQFKPIVTVIELKSADNTDKARKLVQDYVMSNDMAEMVNVKILSQLLWRMLLIIKVFCWLATMVQVNRI